MQWVKHDTNANQDAKLKKLRMKYGLEGYGLYWYCIELIAADIDQNNLTFELEHDAEIISFDTGIHIERVNEMMAHMVNLGLFEASNNTITCLKLLKRLDQSMTSNKQMRSLITKAKEGKNHDSVMTLSDNVMTQSDFVMQEEKRIDKKKNSYPVGINPDLLASISNSWNELMVTQPSIDLTKDTQVNKKRWTKIKKILADHPDYADYEYWEGHIYQLSKLPELQWQRENKQLQFDQAVQLDKFERNLGLMKMGVK